MNQITKNDINISFEQEINLWKIIGNSTCSDILKVVAEQITTDRMDGNMLIALIGKPNTGRRTFSLALNNTLCYEFRETLGDTLAFGGDDIFRSQFHNIYIRYNTVRSPDRSTGPETVDYFPPSQPLSLLHQRKYT